jgi:hypothetical protein
MIQALGISAKKQGRRLIGKGMIDLELNKRNSQVTLSLLLKRRKKLKRLYQFNSNNPSDHFIG